MGQPHADRPVTAHEAAAERGTLRWPDDGLDRGFARPGDVEPLAGRLERAARRTACREMTGEMLARWHDHGAPCAVWDGVWVSGVFVDFIVATWKGLFLIWTVDERWTTRQAAIVMSARARIQSEMAGWPGQVEAVFHSPRESTGWHRHVLLDDESGEPVDIVLMGGRIDELLTEWKPAGGVGLDPEWLRWLSAAAEPRWWRSADGERSIPGPPPHERL
jgi:hypothetical protein